MMIGNRIAAAAVSHEVRNLCSAISLLCANIRIKHGITPDEDLEGLSALVEGLERIASWDLQSKVQDALEQVPLREVLDDLRIVIEPDWQDIGGHIGWQLPSQMPVVLAERHGLLQAFLNLAKNSHRAVQKSSRRELRIDVSVRRDRAMVVFEDSGPGIAAPDQLFQPFQPGAEGTGLGLYVSRVVVRSYGGELRFEPQSSGSCFAVELQIVS